jgi:hypothetical protein
LQTNDTFSRANGYSNPSHPNFGRNQYSNKLGIMNYDGESGEEKAFSWLSLVIEPSVGNNRPLAKVSVRKRF